MLYIRSADLQDPHSAEDGTVLAGLGAESERAL